MTEITEAPMIHGMISVSNLNSSAIQFCDGSSLSKIDTALDLTSSDPVTNQGLVTAIDNIISPTTENFTVHLVMNPSAYHASGLVSFPTRNTFTNDFASGGPNSANSIIVAPTNGTYIVNFRTTSLNSNDAISLNLTLNGQTYKSISGIDSLNYSSTFFLSNGDEISLHSANATHGRSELFVALLAKAVAPP